MLDFWSLDCYNGSMKRNTKQINQVKLLRAAHEQMQNTTDDLNSHEWIEMRNMLARGLDTNILFLNWSDRNELIEQLEAGKITNSKAEQLAIRGGKIENPNSRHSFIVGGAGGDFRPEHWRDFSNEPALRED